MRPSVYYLHDEASAVDARLCNELETWIYTVHRDERQTARWHKVEPGGELRIERLRKMQEADVIFLLLSADFLGRDDCHAGAVAALAERERGAIVIPILLRPIPAFHGLPLDDLQALPRNGMPVSRWRHRDDAWQHICGELRDILTRTPLRSASPHGPAPGATFGQYRILRVLGEGGSGFVYLAEHSFFDRRVAIKSRQPSAEAERLTRWEATVLNAASHPGVVTLYDAGILSDGRPYLVLELLEGSDLSALQAKRPAGSDAWRGYLRLIRQVAETLAALHSRGIVHCDLKPSNILVCPTDEHDAHDKVQYTAKIIDFEGARLQGAASSRLTPDEGSILGTPGYMSPERLLGKDVTDKADVYSFGVILYELCTGHTPFLTSRSMLIAKLRDRPSSIRLLEPTLPPVLAALVDDMLAISPADRPAMSDIVRILGSMFDDITTAPRGITVKPIENSLDPDADTFSGESDTSPGKTDSS